MSIHDFHSALISRSEKNALLEALRKLMSADLEIFSAEEQEPIGGWIPWDGSLPLGSKPAEA